MCDVGAQVAGKSQALVQFLSGLAGEQRTYACLQLAATLVSQAEAQVLSLERRACFPALGRLRVVLPQAHRGPAAVDGLMHDVVVLISITMVRHNHFRTNGG